MMVLELDTVEEWIGIATISGSQHSLCFLLLVPPCHSVWLERQIVERSRESRKICRKVSETAFQAALIRNDDDFGKRGVCNVRDCQICFRGRGADEAKMPAQEGKSIIGHPTQHATLKQKTLVIKE